MYRLNPECWVWSPRPRCLIPQHQQSFTSTPTGPKEEEEEEEVRDQPTVCCYATACDDVVVQAADAQWSCPELPVHSGIPNSSGLPGRGPASPSPQQPITVLHATRGDTSQHVIGGPCWEGPGTEPHGCVCVYGQRGPEALGPCWPGSPYIYYGVRRDVLVGVEVVEEVAVEDTLEVMYVFYGLL
ncbi:hypothetical protein PAMA_015651 [Pampus argenteus]